MRGLGIGIVVTALLMGVATKDGLPLSDAEIRAKALALGMIESDSLKLTDIQNMGRPSGATPAPADGQSGEDVPDGGGEDVPDGGGEQQEPSGDGNGASGGTAPAENTEEAVHASGSGTVTVRIEAGTNSYGASVLIAEAGLVEDAAALDRYLCEQGYSRKIADGTYQIPVGATEEEIAKIITKGR